MAGYMTRLNGYVYDGHHKAAAALTNGLFVEINAANKVAPIAAAKTGLKMKVAEKTTLFGLPAVRLDVIANGDGGVYFVENEWDVNDGGDYDEANYTLAADKFVKMHMPVVNDQLIVSVNDTLYAALAVGDIVNPAANGTIAKATT